MKRLVSLLVIYVIFMLAVLMPHKESSITATQAPSPSVVPSPLVYQKALDSDKLWSLIQEWRVKNNFQPYVKDQRLCQIAQTRAPEIKDEIGRPHAGFFARYSDLPYKISENGTGAYSEVDALDRWLESPAHHQALEAEWKYSCTACSGNACVQIFSNF